MFEINKQFTINISARDFAESLLTARSFEEIIEFIKFLDKEICDAGFTEEMETYFVTETNKERAHENVVPTVLGGSLSSYCGESSI